MSEALKPCPFCGSEARRIEFDGEVTDPNWGGSAIECTKCQASSHVEFGTKENLVSVWNSRAQTAADKAVQHVLNAIRNDGRKAYLLGAGTECFALLTAARADAKGEDLEEFRDGFWSQCRPERVVVARDAEGGAP